MCKIIFIGNYKGGVGKTTTVINLADYFSGKGKKVLTVDLDPQSSLSEIQVYRQSKGKHTLKDVANEHTLNYIFDLSILKIKKYKSLDILFNNEMISNIDENYHFIPSSLFYRETRGLDSITLDMTDDIEYLSILKNYIDKIKNKYHYILIDCPPSSNVITQSAFLMADYYLIPTILDKISTNGVIHYINTVKKTYKKYCVDNEDSILIKHFFGKEPELIGIFYNMIRGQVNYNENDVDFKSEIKRIEKEKSINIKVFESNINNFVDIARATEKGEVSKVKTDFSDLSEQILSFLES